MNTREVASKVRLSQWVVLLREQKSSGMNIKDWCEAQGINRARYFYWQKKLRETACEELAKQTAMEATAPEGWALCPSETRATKQGIMEEARCDQLTMEASGIHIAAGSDYPVEKLAWLLRELQKGC